MSTLRHGRISNRRPPAKKVMGNPSPKLPLGPGTTLALASLAAKPCKVVWSFHPIDGEVHKPSFDLLAKHGCADYSEGVAYITQKGRDTLEYAKSIGWLG